jgi:hypothetical protein
VRRSAAGSSGFSPPDWSLAVRPRGRKRHRHSSSGFGENSGTRRRTSSSNVLTVTDPGCAVVADSRTALLRAIRPVRRRTGRGGSRACARETTGSSSAANIVGIVIESNYQRRRRESRTAPGDGATIAVLRDTKANRHRMRQATETICSAAGLLPWNRVVAFSRTPRYGDSTDRPAGVTATGLPDSSVGRAALARCVRCKRPRGAYLTGMTTD